MGIQIKAAIDFMTASGIAMPALVPLRRLLGGLEDLDFGTKIDFLAPSPRPHSRPMTGAMAWEARAALVGAYLALKEQRVPVREATKRIGPVANSGVGRRMGCADPSFTLC